MDKVWFKNLQKVREAKGYTQVKLSMMVGVSQQTKRKGQRYCYQND